MDTIKRLDRQLKRGVMKLRMQNPQMYSQYRTELVEEHGEEYVQCFELEIHMELMAERKSYLKKHGTDPGEYEKEYLRAR